MFLALPITGARADIVRMYGEDVQGRVVSISKNEVRLALGCKPDAKIEAFTGWQSITFGKECEYRTESEGIGGGGGGPSSNRAACSIEIAIVESAPLVAKNVRLSDDHTSVVATLRQGVKRSIKIDSIERMFVVCS